MTRPSPASLGLSLLGACLGSRLLWVLGRIESSACRGCALHELRLGLAGAWQDALLVAGLVLLLLAGGRIIRRPTGLALLFVGALCFYTAINLPVALVLGGPLTAPMLAGAGGALSDSIRLYMDLPGLLGIAAVLALAWGLGRAGLSAARGKGPELPLGGALAAMVLASALAPALGPAFGDPVGDVRESAAFGTAQPNAVLTLLRTGLRLAIAPGQAPAATRDPGGLADPPLLPAEGDAVDLRSLRGRAAGRHLVWVVLESTPAKALGLYGAPVDPMPNLSRLAEKGIVFDWAYTGMPESVKGLYSLVCSRLVPPYHRAAELSAGRRPCRALPAILAGEGYRGGLFHSGRFAYLGMEAIIADRGYHDLVDAALIPSPHASSFGVDEAATVDAILGWLDREGRSDGAARSDRGHQPDHPGRPDSAGPVFLHYLPIAGHHPYETPGDGPRPFGEADEASRHRSDLAVGDAALGRLIDAFEQRGLMEQSLWLIHGDHGEAFLEHPGNFAHSLYLYEENVRVPLVLVAPGLTDPRLPGNRTALPRRAPQIASLVDLAPTLADLFGIARPPDWRGRSLLEPVPGLARFRTDHQTWLEGLRQGPWKFILDRDSGRTELYDLRVDPGETADLSAAQPRRVERYRDHLDAAGD